MKACMKALADNGYNMTFFPFVWLQVLYEAMWYPLVKGLLNTTRMTWYSESGAHDVYIYYVCIHGSHIPFVDTTYRFCIMIRCMFSVPSMLF